MLLFKLRSWIVRMCPRMAENRTEREFLTDSYIDCERHKRNINVVSLCGTLLADTAQTVYRRSTVPFIGMARVLVSITTGVSSSVLITKKLKLQRHYLSALSHSICWRLYCNSHPTYTLMYGGSKEKGQVYSPPV